MNWDMMKKNVGRIFRLAPTERRLTMSGRRQPDRIYDWNLTDTTGDILVLENISTGHILKLGKDYIFGYGTDAERGGQYGYLTLKCQVFLQGREVKIVPNARPGEPVDPPAIVEPIDKVVDFNYPTNSGITADLKAKGYTVVWCRESRVADQTDNGNYEIVVVDDREGLPTRFRLKTRPEDSVLLMRPYGPEIDPP
jgi:hypothetical protein